MRLERKVEKSFNFFESVFIMNDKRIMINVLLILQVL